jgi:hypothetical protein
MRGPCLRNSQMDTVELIGSRCVFIQSSSKLHLIVGAMMPTCLLIAKGGVFQLDVEADIRLLMKLLLDFLIYQSAEAAFDVDRLTSLLSLKEA